MNISHVVLRSIDNKPLSDTFKEKHHKLHNKLSIPCPSEVRLDMKISLKIQIKLIFAFMNPSDL